MSADVDRPATRASSGDAIRLGRQVRKLADELDLQLTPSLREQLRRAIAAEGYAVARERVAEALSQPRAQTLRRQRVCQRLLLGGVTVVDPATTYVEDGVDVGRGTVIHPNTVLSGRTRIGGDCQVGPNTIIRDSTVGDCCRVVASVVEDAVLEEEVTVGPFGHLRSGTHLAKGVHIGSFAEVKKSRLGRDTKMGHFGYVGDAQVGDDVNIGAGTVTCNYDGVAKHRTVIGRSVFIGSDTMLVAPIKLGDGASTGAGSVVNRDVPPDTLAVGAPARMRSKKQRRSPKGPVRSRRRRGRAAGGQRGNQ
jgi:bifunctional UDP-N-acetylglucosamine pyrophosphorylase/glucosamine-1-phosphate N-acetyltransferase